ncbi:MAG: S8 family serine peptidase [Proteobacteria bacterium]|nr:S8 family serine peptidase [Pseudomonadota bacterium]
MRLRPLRIAVLALSISAWSAAIAEPEDREIEVPEVEVPEVKTPEVEPREVETPEVEAPEVETREVEAPETESHGISEDSGHSEAAETSTERSDTAEGLSDRDYGWIADAVRDEAFERDDEGAAVRAGEVVVSALPPEALDRLLRAGFRVIERKQLAALGADLTRLGAPSGLSTRAAVQRVRAEAPGATIDFDHYYGLGLASGQRPRKLKGANGGAPAATAGFSVGVLDTAVAPHPAIAGARLVAWRKGAREGLPAAGKAARHGTAVASILVAGGARTVYSANIFRGTPDRPFTSIDVVADALEWLVGTDAPVINMSIAGPRNAILDQIVAAATARGRIVVAAAGNAGPAAPPVYPAALGPVVAVTAVDKTMHIYRYANRGPYVDFAAPGVDVTAADAMGGFSRFTGTSFAAPAVAASLARCRTRLSPAACTASLQASARDLGTPGFDTTFGYGLVE